jgi:hypothetical protein
MALPGNGFIALWNDIDPARTDYDVWHTTEHVPERLTVPGFLCAHRYVLLEGKLPSYFTLYALESLGALGSEAYRQLLQKPTSWTLGMRPDFRNFLRFPCQTTLTQGLGLGGYAAVRLLSVGEADQVISISESLMTSAGVCSVHLGAVDEGAAPFEVNMPAAKVSPDVAAVLVIEGYDRESMRGSCASLALGQSSPWSFYRLAFALRSSRVPKDLDEKPSPDSRILSTAQSQRP